MVLIGMVAQLKIDQVGLPAGVAGVARTDGLDTGALVTLTNTGSGGSTTRFVLLWVPLGDITAVLTLTVTGNPLVWTFLPTAAVWGTYLILLIQDEGLPTQKIERRIFGVRTPSRRLLIPALNEAADPRATLANANQARIDASDDNATDYVVPELNSLRFAGWWRALQELFTAVEAGGGGGGAVSSVKGSGGITPTIPQVGNVILSGASLYDRAGANGAMSADVSFGGFSLLSALNASFSGGVTAVTYNGVPLTTSGPSSQFLNKSGAYAVPPMTLSAGGANNLNKADGSGGWIATDWFIDGGANLTKGTGVGTVLAEGVTLIATTNYGITLSSAGNGSLQVSNIAGKLQLSPSAGSSQIFGKTGGGGVGALDPLQINGIGFPSVTDTSYAGIYLRMPTSDSVFGDYLRTDGAGQLEWQTPPVPTTLQGAYQNGATIAVTNAFGSVALTQAAGTQSTLTVAATNTPFPALKVTAVGTTAIGIYAVSQGTTAQPAILAEAQSTGGEGLRCRHAVLNGGNAFVAESNGVDVIRARNGIVGLGQALLAVPNADGTSGQYVTTNGAGQLGFTTLPAAPTLYNQQIQDEGTNLTQRPTLNFIGQGVVAVDNGGSSRTDVTIQGAVMTVINASTGQAPTLANLLENRIYAVSVSAAPVTVTLPASAPPGTPVTIKDRFQGGSQASTNNITITAAGGETIDGVSSQIIATDLGSISLIKGLSTDWLLV